MVTITGERVELLDDVEATVGQRSFAALGRHPCEPRARRWLLAAAVLAGEHTGGEREVREDGEVVPSQASSEVLLAATTKHAQLVLHADERRRPGFAALAAASSSRRPSKFEHPISRTLPSRHESVERFERLVDRSRVVGRVQLVQVDAVGPQPSQASFDAPSRSTPRSRPSAAWCRRPCRTSSR